MTALSSQKTKILSPDADALAEAASLIRNREPVAFPTETVYGLGANALDDFAVSAIFAIKDRPRFNPLIVHVRDAAQAEDLVDFHPLARLLAETFWPGGLTLVLKRKAASPLSLLASAGLDTAALRAPAHETAQALLRAAGVPIAAPSANRSGRVSPTTAQAVAEELSGRIPLILDAGPSEIGIESTVIGFDGEKPLLLRPGAIPREAVEAVSGKLESPSGPALLSPGMMESHYAPHARMRLEAAHAKPGEAFLAFGAQPAHSGPSCNLSPSGDLREAAANLFSMLRTLDKSGAPVIAVAPIPSHGLGEAINDRLVRAAAPRP